MLKQTSPGVQRTGVTLLLAGLAILATIIYWPALSGPFLLDDLVNIPDTRVTSLSGEQLWQVATGNESGRFGRSIPVVTFALNYYFGGDGTFSFKLTNLILHLVNGLLLYVLLFKLVTALQRNSQSNMSFDPMYFSLLVAGIWLVHPLQLSGVMYVVQRMNMLSTFFTFLALLVFVSFRLNHWVRQRVSVTSSVLPILVIASLILLACLSKENGVLAVAYIGVIELFVFRFQLVEGRTSRRYACAALLGGLALLILSCVYLYFNGASLIHAYLIREFSLAERLLTQASVLLFYLRQIIVPDVGLMSLYIDDFTISRGFDGRTVLALGALGALCIIGIALRRRLPLVSLGIGVFLASHLLESTFIPLEMVFEHRNYFGLWGIALAACNVAYLILARIQHHYRYAIAAACIAMLSLQTFGRAVVWGDEFLHNAHAAEARPLSRRSQTAFAISLARNGHFDTAEEVMRRAESLGMDPAFTALRLLALKGMRNQVKTEDIERVLATMPQQPLMIRHGSILVDVHTNFDNNRFDRPNLEDMISLYQVMAEHNNPRLLDSDRARILGMYAELLLGAGRTDEARKHINEAYRLNPMETELIVRKAEVEFASGDGAALKQTLELVVGNGTQLTRNQFDRVNAMVEPVQISDADEQADEAL